MAYKIGQWITGKSKQYDSSYAPPDCYSSTEEERLEWVYRNRNLGISFLESNKAWRVASYCMGILLGDNYPQLPQGMSRLTVNKLRRIAREGIATQSNIRPRWGFKSFKDEYKPQIDIFNKLLNSWWYNNFIDRSVRGALQYAAGAGIGYLSLEAEKDVYSEEVEIIAKVKSHKNIFIVHMPQDNTLQKAYVVIDWEEMPLPEAHRRYWLFKDRIKANRGAPSNLAKGLAKIKRIASALDIINSNREAAKNIIDPFPTVDVYKIYVKDFSINTTGEIIVMGDVGTNYCYEVPSYYQKDGTSITQVFSHKSPILDESGQEIRNPISGELELEDVFRNITLDECRKFPDRRFIVCTDHCIIYDGPTKSFHGLVPIVPFRFDDVAGQWVGFPIFYDAIYAAQSANNIFRTIEDSINNKINPAVAIHNGVGVEGDFADKFNPRKSTGQKFKFDLTFLKDLVRPILPVEFYKLDGYVFEFAKGLLEFCDYLSGTQDMSFMYKANQLPASDTQESLLAKSGPLSTDQSRGMERSLLELGLIWGGLALQHYNIKRRIQILGHKGMSVDHLDFDPDSLVPYISETDKRNRYQRAKDFYKSISFWATPNSLHERNSMTRKLSLLQIRNMEVPISDRTVYDNFVDDGRFDEERAEYFKDLEEKLEMTERIKAKIQAGESGNPLQQILAKLQGEKAGRPATNNEPARIEQKTRDGVPDQTLATS